MSKYDGYDANSARRKELKRTQGQRAAATAQKRPAVWAKTNGHCWYCGTEVMPPGSVTTKTDFTVDHVVPMIEGGADELENLVPACFSCNSRKQRRDIKYLRRAMSGIPFFTEAQEAYLATLGVMIPEGDYVFYFEREALG